MDFFWDLIENTDDELAAEDVTQFLVQRYIQLEESLDGQIALIRQNFIDKCIEKLEFFSSQLLK